MKNLSKNLALAAFSIIFILVVLEVAFRFIDIKEGIGVRTKYINLAQSLVVEPHPLYMEHKDDPGLVYKYYGYRPGSVWATEYPSNPRSTFDDKNRIYYKINSDGYRDYEFGPKSDKVFRITAIGDSFTIGEGVYASQSFPKVVEKSLRAKGAGVEVFNLGVNGHGIRDEWVTLDTALPRYRPDLVLWAYVLNDISHADIDLWTLRKRGSMKKGANTPSKLYNYIKKRLQRRSYSGDYFDFINQLYQDPTMWGELEKLFKEAVLKIRKNNADIVVILFPDLNGYNKDGYRFEPVHEKLRAIFEANGVSYIDMTKSYQEYGPLKLRVHAVDAHPNEIAHQIAAEALASEIASRLAPLPLPPQ